MQIEIPIATGPLVRCIRGQCGIPRMVGRGFDWDVEQSRKKLGHSTVLTIVIVPPLGQVPVENFRMGFRRDQRRVYGAAFQQDRRTVQPHGPEETIGRHYAVGHSWIPSAQPTVGGPPAPGARAPTSKRVYSEGAYILKSDKIFNGRLARRQGSGFDLGRQPILEMQHRYTVLAVAARIVSKDVGR